MVTERNLLVLDSSSSDDGSLFDPIFGDSSKVLQKTSSSRKKKEKPRKAASLTITHDRNDVGTATSSSLCSARPVLKLQDEEDHERMKEIASRKAGIAMLPEGITSSSQLVWYHDTESAAYYPCRICEPSEALHVRLDPTSWDPSEVALVQALALNGKTPFGGRDRLLVNKTSLEPYYGQSNDTNKWSSSLWKCYQDQRRQQARRTHTTLTTTDLETEALFLDRILQAAREREYDSEQERLSSDSSSIASDDLEVPYSENLLPEDDFMDVFSDHQTEPLRPGDVVEYTHPIFVKGDRRGYREATVLSTDPDRNPVLVLSNGECLPSDAVVRRKQVLEHGQLYKHPHGFFRPIECFKIEKSGEATVLDGMQEEGRRVGAIVDKNIAIVAKQGRANGFAPMDLFHKRSQGATVNENRGVSKATNLSREDDRKKHPPLVRPSARRAIENRGIQRRHAAARGDESDSSVSNDAGIQIKNQFQSGRKGSAPRLNGTANDGVLSESSLSSSGLRKLSVKKRVSMASDSSLSSSDLRELSVSKIASVVMKKNGVTAVNVDSDSDDSTGPQFTCPHNALGGGRTVCKQRSSASAEYADSNSNLCFDSSGGVRERPGATKKRYATSTGSDVSSPSPYGLSGHIRPRVSSKSTATQAEASSITSLENGSDVKASRRWRLDDGRQSDAQKLSDAAKRKSWDESSDDESQLPGAIFSTSCTKSRQPPTNVPSDRLEESSSSDSMLQESSAREVASSRSNGTKSMANEKSPEAPVDYGSLRKEKSSRRLFSPRDAGAHWTASVGSSGRMKPARPQHRRDPDPLSFPSSDESSINQQRKDHYLGKKKFDSRLGVNVHGSSIRTEKSPRANDEEVDSSDSSVISFSPHPGRLGASKRPCLQGATNGWREESSHGRFEGVVHSVVARGFAEKSLAIDPTTNESDTSGNAENRLPRNHPVPLGSTLSVPTNAGWMKKIEKKPAATATVRVEKPSSFGLSFTKQNVRKSRPVPPPKAVAVSLRQCSKSPTWHSKGAVVHGKADLGTSCLSERDNFSSRNGVKKTTGGDDLIDSDDGMNTQTLPRKRLFQSSERGKAASLASVQGTPVVKRHKVASNQYGSEQKPRSHFSKVSS